MLTAANSRQSLKTPAAQVPFNPIILKSQAENPIKVCINKPVQNNFIAVPASNRIVQTKARHVFDLELGQDQFSAINSIMSPGKIQFSP